MNLNEYCKKWHPDIKAVVEYLHPVPRLSRGTLLINILNDDLTIKYGARFYPLEGESHTGIIDKYFQWSRTYDGKTK